MESVYLKTLVEVVKAGSISKAADTLCVTQPAVSRRIKFIEEQYGYMLLDRSGQKLVPTDAGKLVCEKAELMLAIERELLTGLKSIHEKKSIAFICTPTFGIVHLPTIMREFMMEYNDLADLSFMFDMPGNIVEALKDGMYDLAVLEHCECFDLSELTTVALPGDDMIFVSAPVLGITSGTIDLEEIFSQTMLARKEGCCSRTLLDANLRALGRDLTNFRSCVVIDDLHMILASAQTGQGVSFLSRELVQDQIDAGLLREHSIEGFRHHRNRTLVIHSGCGLLASSPQKYFIERIRDRFGLPIQPRI
jgi:DNA-binding transcriptional LysR family regulator